MPYFASYILCATGIHDGPEQRHALILHWRVFDFLGSGYVRSAQQGRAAFSTEYATASCERHCDLIDDHVVFSSPLEITQCLSSTLPALSSPPAEWVGCSHSHP